NSFGSNAFRPSTATAPPRRSNWLPSPAYHRHGPHRKSSATGPLVNVIENPLGCYEEARYPSREVMIREIMSVYDPPPFPGRPAAPVAATASVAGGERGTGR
ncbi:MAG: hypothetical protein M3O34_06500, partial [Chloroflexota bacterium]|nr:hypothetical protein [Chloroflexota bacterium]